MLLSAFLWCSITSPKNSSSFNLSPTLAIIFITYQNHHQMKNNIRCKGNINNTSVINFFLKSKTPSDSTLLGRTSSEVFVLLLFISFLIFILLLYLHLSMFFILLLFFIHIFFPTLSLTVPWTIAGFLHPFYTFSQVHHRVIRETFIFNHFVIVLPRALHGFKWTYFIHRQFFYLALLHRHFNNLRELRFPWEPSVLPWGLQGFILILETQPRSRCLYDSQ